MLGTWIGTPQLFRLISANTKLALQRKDAQTNYCHCNIHSWLPTPILSCITPIAVWNCTCSTQYIFHTVHPLPSFTLTMASFFFFEFVRFQGLVTYICSLLKGLQQESRFLIGGNCAWLLDCSSWEVLITRFTMVQRSNWQPHVLNVVDLLILASLWSFDQLVRTLIPASSWSPTLQQEKCKWLFLGCLLSHSAWRKPVFTMYCWI